VSAKSTLEDEGFDDIIPIHTAAEICDDHEDGIDDRKSYKAATEFPLTIKCHTVMKEELEGIGQHQVFGDFMELPEERKALPGHWVHKIKRDGASNVQRFKARRVCGENHLVEDIDYQAAYALTAHVGPC
jgi:hypothetical protein